MLEVVELTDMLEWEPPAEHLHIHIPISFESDSFLIKSCFPARRENASASTHSGMPGISSSTFTSVDESKQKAVKIYLAGI